MDQTLTSNVTDTALLFEGGGMRAAYTSAVVVELLRAGVHADFVAGISAGASNSVNYVARAPERARQAFVDFADDPRFGNWRTFLQGKGMFNAEYIYQHAGLPEAALPFDFEAFQANPARLTLAGFDAHTGQTRWWTREDMATLEDLMLRVRASSTMPILMPPVSAEGTVFVDGALGVDGGIPVTAADEAGFTKLLVIMTRERSYVKEPERYPSIYRRAFRRMPAVAEALTTRWKRYNATRERLFEMERAGDAYLFVPETMPISNGERSVARLTAAHELGLAQARREMPAIKEFLGL